MKILLPVLLALIAAPTFAKTLTIGIDVSESNPLVTSQTAAKAASSYARDAIAALELGDQVRIRRFGARHVENMPSERLRITRKTRADSIAASVAGFIASLASKNAQGDNETNILAFFELGAFDCPNGERIVLFTDGIEASRTMSDRAFLSGASLPAPQPGYLEGCTVVMFGLGQSKDGSLPPRLAQGIRDRWADYFRAAGASFTAITD